MAEQAIEQAFVQSPIFDRASIHPLRRLLWEVRDAQVVTWRNILHYVRLPELLVWSTIQPVMFVLLFAYVFGGAIDTPNGKYINYLLPGILVQTVVFGGWATSIGLAEDMSKGLIDRFRSLPMARSAVLAGRTTADSLRNLFVVILMITVGVIIGFELNQGVLATAGAIVLLVLFGHVMSWIFAYIGVLVKDPETAQAASFVWVFPLVFASSIFVPVETMPRGLRTFAEHQPITVVTNAVRGLFLEGSAADVPLALAWMAVIFVIAAPVAIRQYRRSA
jgi:ABC-2 type transport system permease protein/oleandomycin transport system permease protein